MATRRRIRSVGELNPRADHRAIMAEIERELWDIGADLVLIAVDYIDRKGISVDGDIRDSIKALVKKIIRGLRVEFGANAAHAIYVHEGTRPHWPPAKPIRTWVRKKLNPPAAEIDDITFLVQRKIAREGTKAKPFIDVAVRAIEQQIPSRIEAAIIRAN